MKKFFCAAFFIFCVSAPCAAGLAHEFFMAVRAGNEATVKKMLRKSKELVFLADEEGRTPFLAAVEDKNVSMAYLLAEYWSRLTVLSDKGNAVHIAVLNEDSAMVKMLVHVAAREDPQLAQRLVNAPRATKGKGQWAGADLNTPLHLAAQKCNRDIYQYLISRGAEPDRRNAAWETPQQILARCPAPSKSAVKTTKSARAKTHGRQNNASSSPQQRSRKVTYK